MPSLSFINTVGHLQFISHNLQLPGSSWKQPNDQVGSEQYGRAIKVKDRKPQLVPAWFQPNDAANDHFVNTCDKVGKEFKDLHDALLDALKFGVDLWRLKAKFQNLKIMAVIAIGTPGCLDGPALENLIKKHPAVAAYVGNRAKYLDAFAAGVSKSFKTWQDAVTMCLPLFPAFAAFPGPMAPPASSIPVPLASCPSAGMVAMTSEPLKQEMINAFDSGLKQKDPDGHYIALFDALAKVVSMGFVTWLPGQQVQCVMGTGSIPTFAPPFVLVGPVMNGDTLPTPGHLLA